jgi:hypothetical protein
MTKASFATYCCLASLSAALTLAGCNGNSGIKASDPHLEGNRDMNYDHLIVPGDRIGPVQMGGSVRAAIQHLGEPDSVNRSTFRGPGYYADEVYYYYRNECIQFTWMDSDVDPKIETGYRGINVTCDKWKTAGGLHVGSPIRDVISQLGAYCPSNRSDGSLLIATKEGIWYEAADRNSSVSRILIVPRSNDWGGMCKD